MKRIKKMGVTISILFIALVAMALIAHFFGRIHADQKFKNEVTTLLESDEGQQKQRYSEQQLIGLPEPVQKYFRHVLPEGIGYIKSARLKHTGFFKTSLDGNWIPIQGEQYFTCRKPGFVWRGKTSMFSATDKLLNEKGSLTVKLLGSITFQSASGEKYNQGELLRWLGECIWFPTSLLPNKNLSWSPIDSSKALLTYRLGTLKVHYEVTFNEANEIAEIKTMRYLGNNKLECWIGRASGYKAVDKVIVPTCLEGYWVVEGKEKQYANFRLTTLEYNTPKLFNE